MVREPAALSYWFQEGLMPSPANRPRSGAAARSAHGKTKIENCLTEFLSGRSFEPARIAQDEIQAGQVGAVLDQGLHVAVGLLVAEVTDPVEEADNMLDDFLLRHVG